MPSASATPLCSRPGLPLSNPARYSTTSEVCPSDCRHIDDPRYFVRRAGRDSYEKAIATAWPRRMSEATLLEAAMVVESRSGTAAGHELLLETVSIELVPVTTGHADAARRALTTLW